MEKEGSMITDWLDQYGDPEIEAFVEKNLAITTKVIKALDAKGWSKSQLAEAMDKKPSEVSKWLSGMHNLTLKSIIKMERALGIDLLHCEPIKEYEYVFLGVIKSVEDSEVKVDEYTSSTVMEEFSIAM
jgi:transcriptional regulator with XRE-family HTH domain